MDVSVEVGEYAQLAGADADEEQGRGAAEPDVEVLRQVPFCKDLGADALRQLILILLRVLPALSFLAIRTLRGA